MAQHKASESILVTAARALDRELEEFARNAEQVRRAPLTTQRQIERAYELLAAVAPAEQVVRARIDALEEAVVAANVARAAQTESIGERRPHIDLRAAELQRLLGVYIALGVRATGVQGALADPGADQALEVIAGEVDTLLVAARRGDFPDIIRIAEALGKQIATTRAKHRGA